MPIPSKPSLLRNVIGYDADVFSLPDTTVEGSGALSYESGWPRITGTSLKAGGKAPQREYFNQVNKMLSQHLFFMQSGNVYDWDASLNYNAGAHVLGSDGLEYVAVSPSGPDVPGVGAKDPAGSRNKSQWLLLAALLMSSDGGLVVDPLTGKGAVDFEQMPTEKFEALLKSIRVPIWLTKSLTVYVATTGSDTLDDGRGLTPDKPFASIQAAVNYVSTTYNLYKYNATISVAPGNYGREHILLPSYTTSTGKLIIKGSGAARTDVVCGRFVSSYASIYEIYNLTIFQKDVTSGTVGSVEASAGQIDLYNVQVNFAGIQQGTGQLWGVFVYGSGVVRAWSTASADIPNGLFFNCAGAEPYGLIIASGSRFEFAADITVTGDAAWKSCAVLAQQAGVVSRSLSAAPNPGRRPNVNTEGTITGRRYTANLNGLVNVAGAGPDFWPGDTEGNVSSGGQYA